MTTKTTNSDNEKLAQLSNRLCDNYEGLLSKLDVSLEDSGKYFVGCCPIHSGDNRTAFNLFKDGHTVRGNWVCRTRQCEYCFKPTILGFIRGILSSKNGWCDKSDTNKVLPFYQVVNWACEFLKTDWGSLKADGSILESKKYIATMESLSRKKLNSVGTPRETAIKCLSIPSPYILQRGFSEDILRTYDVGLCLKSNNGFHDRSIIPVYDETGKIMVAYTGRSIFDKCNKCNSYHNPKNICPDEKYLNIYCKWKHSPNINNYLFNYNNAKPYIKKSQTVILVEGPLDCLKLCEAGINNSVAIFGTSISEQQQITLETSGAWNVIAMLDMDEAGRFGCEKIKKQLSRSYNVRIVNYGKKDVGELTIDEVKELFK